MIVAQVLLRHWCSERSRKVGVEVMAMRTGRHEWVLLISSQLQMIRLGCFQIVLVLSSLLNTYSVHVG